MRNDMICQFDLFSIESVNQITIRMFVCDRKQGYILRRPKISNMRNSYGTRQILVLWVQSIPKMQKY